MITMQAVGRLTDAPELSQTARTGTAVCRLRLACPKWRASDEADFLTVYIYGDKPAANSAKYLTKGQQVTVMGHAEQKSWRGDDGGGRSQWVLNAHRVTYGAKPKGEAIVNTIEVAEDGEPDE